MDKNNKTKLRISVTGGEGFLGGALSKLLYLPKESIYDIVSGRDVTKAATQRDIANNSDIVIHLAALSGLKACDDQPEYAKKLNTESTFELARKCKTAGVKRFIFSSSSAVYGEAAQYRMDEKHSTCPRSLYGETKLMAERILEYADKNFEVLILRQSNLYGYGLIWKGITVIDKFLEAFINHEPMPIMGTGAQKRDFVHVMDVMALYAKLAKANKCRSGVYNVGGTETFSIRALAEMINDIGESLLGYRVPLQFKESGNEVLFHDFKYDYTKAIHEFQYQPVMTIDSYVKERFGIAVRTRLV